MIAASRLALAVLTLSFGCATGGDPGPGRGADGSVTGDGGGGGGDGGGREDGGGGDMDGGGRTDAGRDAGGGACPSGQHRCGGGCIDDQPNMPENGCRLGCGEPCAPPEFGTPACGTDGLCDFACEPPAVRSGDGCVCDARSCSDLGAMCGTVDDGCGGMIDCGGCTSGTCMSGRCTCAEDAAEPNDSQSIPTLLTELTDAPDSMASYDTYGLHDGGDVDWFRFRVRDDFDAGNPIITITLDGIPGGSNYDLGAWFVCDSRGDSSACTMGTTDAMIGMGCTASSGAADPETVRIETECSGTDESGTVYVRILSTAFGGSCDLYTLSVDVR